MRKNSDGKPCSGVRGDQQVSTDQQAKQAMLFPYGEAVFWERTAHAALNFKNKGEFQMKRNQTLRITIAGLLCGIAVIGSMFSFPVFGSKCSPVQHMVNVLCAVLLGPWYGLGAAFLASLLRNLMGLGSLLAFPGSMCGALLCGLVYKKFRHILPTMIGEVFGTGVIGGLLAYPIAVLFMGVSAASVGFYAYIVPFLISTVAGSLLAGILVLALQKNGALGAIQKRLN